MAAKFLTSCGPSTTEFVETDVDFTVTDCLCAKNLVIFVTEPDVTITLPDEACLGQTVTVVAQEGPVTITGDGLSEPIVLQAGETVTLIGGPNGSFTQVRMPACQYVTQDTWWINATTGKDSNDGKTPATALKTMHELCSRYAGAIAVPPSGVVTVNIVGDLPSTDPIQGFDFFLAPGVVLIFDSQPTVLRSGTFITTTPQNRPANQKFNGTSAGGFSVNERVQLADGSFAYVLTSSGDFGEWGFPVPILFGGIFLEELPQPGPGDAFDVVRLSEVSLGNVAIKSILTGFGGTSVVFQNLAFRDDGYDVDPGTAMFATFSGCRFDCILTCDLAQSCFLGCHFDHFVGPKIESQFCLFFGNSSTSVQDFLMATKILIASDVILQGERLFITGGVVIAGNIAVFDVVGVPIQNGFDDGIVIAGGALASEFPATIIWGSGNGRYGVEVRDQSTMGYGSAALHPSITGTVSDFGLAGEATGSWYERASGLWTAQVVPCTWTAFFAAKGPVGAPTGFGQEAINPNYRCGIANSDIE